jgi:hypothetical protein
VFIAQQHGKICEYSLINIEAHYLQKWLASKVGHLRHISDRATDSSRQESGKLKHNRRWTMVVSTEPRSDGVPVYLPLNQETAVLVYYPRYIWKGSY